MPKAFKCSKCGELFEGEPSFSTDLGVGEEDVEICEEDHETLIAWFDGHEFKSLDEYDQMGLEGQ